MDEVAELLRATFRTANRVAFPLSATGSGGMQAMVDNLIGPGDRVVCGVHGLFGERMADALGAPAPRSCASRPSGAARSRPRRCSRPPRGLRARCSSSTARPPPASPSRSTAWPRPAAHDALLLVDCVTSLAGHPLDLDAAGVDAAFSGTQKCLNCPPGLAPFTVGERATEGLQRRSWYFDLEAILGYWRDGGAGRPRLPPHRADQHGLRAARGAGDRARGGPRGALGAPRHRPRGAAPRARRAGLRAPRARRRATAAAARRAVPEASTTPPAVRGRCCATTRSRSPAASGRSPAAAGGSA